MSVTILKPQVESAVVVAPESPRQQAPAPDAQRSERQRPASKASVTGREMTVVIARGVDELRKHEAAWQVLVEHVLEPNIYYEPCALLPAVEAFGAEVDLHFAFLYAPDPLRPQGEKILCGLFPLERLRSYKGLPLATFRLWKHDHSYLCTPLLRDEHAGETLAAFFDWLESNASPCRLMTFRGIAGDGAFRKLLLEELNKRGNLSFHDEWYNRALLKPRSTEPSYVDGISGRHQKELRRKLNRLADEGIVEFAVLEAGGDVDTWIADFLRLEAGGWKGQEGSAFASSETAKKFFEGAVKRAHERGQLMMLALRLDGQPLAMKCNFLSGRGSFAFKIAFDESFARYSPGVLLELENMRQIAEMPDVEWMDSCAASEHFMINRLWTNRRLIETIVVSTGKRPADFVISALPLLRWLKRKLRRRRQED